MNLEHYTLVHKDDNAWLKKRVKELESGDPMKQQVKELEAQLASLMDLTSTKRIWAAEMSLKSFGDVIKAGDLLADRKNCTCAISIMTPCSDCSKAIANWKTVTSKETKP